MEKKRKSGYSWRVVNRERKWKENQFFLLNSQQLKLRRKLYFLFLFKPHRILSFQPCLRTTFRSVSMSLLRLWKELVGSESGMVSVSELKLFCLSPCCHNEDSCYMTKFISPKEETEPVFERRFCYFICTKIIISSKSKNVTELSSHRRILLTLTVIFMCCSSFYQ